ncbi:hypothetical protein ACFYSH_28110 [Streptomyces sp. NPDC005791]|uniref:hypothetical protein n=1 Tax=Streptomyces sp. NPDC005791 TaxID=3364732 RepID=UPI0036759756
MSLLILWLRERFRARLDVVGSVTVVARELGVNRNTAFGWARKAGLRSQRWRHPGRDEYERLRAIGVARRVAARQVGVNERTAKDWDWGVKKSGTTRTYADGRRAERRAIGERLSSVAASRHDGHRMA